MNSAKKTMLYISPTIPASSGNGRAMRAFNAIKYLSGSYHIHLLVISREVNNPENNRFASKACKLCDSIRYIPINPLADLNMLFRVRLFKFSRTLYYRFFNSIENLYCSSKMIRTLKTLYPDISFDTIHIFRIYMMGFAACFMPFAKAPLLQLDLDDIESRTHFRLSTLYKINNHLKMAEKIRRDAESFQNLEKRVLQKVNRVFVCSADDEKWLSDRYKIKNTAILPNIIEIPPIQKDFHPKIPFTFLFIGSFGYYPNYEAVIHFCQNILPLIKEKTAIPFEIRIVGTNIPKKLAKTLSAASNLKIIGTVPDVTPHYYSADAMIVPVRAGGGTRIKVLEAFAHLCPVISTKLGVEGIAGVHEEHFLSSDSDKEFARHCLKLMSNPQLARRLALNAYDLVKARYVFEVLSI